MMVMKQGLNNQQWQEYNDLVAQANQEQKLMMITIINEQLQEQGLIVTTQ